MKLLLLILVFLPLSFSYSACNLELAQASGKYLELLESASLRSYQNRSVCEVLDQEIAACTKKQMAKIEKQFNPKIILGSYCQPHLPPYPSTNKEQFLKGAELYSWKENEGYFWYSLLPGTNRQKSASEIKANKMSYRYLLAKIEQLPPKIIITWNHETSNNEEEALNLSLPDQSKVKAIKSQIERSKLLLQK